MIRVHQWTGEPDEYADTLADLTPTACYQTEGQSFEVPTREDYHVALRDAGALRAGETIAFHAELTAAVQAHWHAGGHNACVFAADLSGTRAQSGWETHVLEYREDWGGVAAQEIAEAIAELCRPRLLDPAVEVVSAILPQLEDELALAGVVWHLGSLPDWDLRELGIVEVTDLGEVVLLGVRAKVELDHWAEILGFGRFPGQANTRLAPFTELAIRAKEPARPRSNRRAYMADIEMDLDKIEFGQWWHETVRQRAERLGAEQDARGKARVTYALDRAAWEEVRR